MTLPKKRIRKIKVQGEEYYYTIKLEHYCMTIQTAVALVSSPNNRFYFSVKQGDETIVKEKSEKYNPGSITPNIVSKAITYVIKNTDWTNSKETVHLLYSKNSFSLPGSKNFN